MKSKSTEATRAKAEALAEVSEEKRSVEELTKQLGEVAMEMVKTVKKEREEVESAKEIEAKYGKVGRTLRVRLDAVKADIAEVEIQLMARRARKLPRPSFALLTFPRSSNLCLLTCLYFPLCSTSSQSKAKGGFSPPSQQEQARTSLLRRETRTKNSRDRRYALSLLRFLSFPLHPLT